MHVSVNYDFEGTRWNRSRQQPFSGSKLLGIDYFHNATWVMLYDVKTSSRAVPLLKQLPNLCHVQLAVDHLDDTDGTTRMLRNELPGVDIEVEPAP